MRTFPYKDPSATLDYEFDWSDWLGDDQILAYEIIVPAGIVLEPNHSQSLGVVTYWISGGTANTTYEIVCEIETVLGRIDQKTARIPVKNT